jgi:muramoyltetrapeptide carboxypeptidase LdcA involved in peptidoglycan recycling
LADHLHGLISGTDQERLTDFQRMLDDTAVKAILCGRGGYGTGRIIEQIELFLLFDKAKMDHRI